MQDDGRFIPPAPGRIFAFSRKGGFGKSRLLPFGLGVLAFAAVLHFLKSRLYTEWVRSMEAGLSRIASQTSAEDALRLSFGSAVDAVWPLLLASLSGGLVGALVPALISRRGKAFTAVPLPEIPRARAAVMVLRCFGTLVFAAACALIIREMRIPTMAGPDPAAWIRVLGHAGLKALFTLGLIAVLIGAGERLVLQHAAYSALFLNRAEHRRERRASEGVRDLPSRERRRLQEERAR